MPNQTHAPTVTVGNALYIYNGVNPKDAQTIRSIVKKLFPQAEAMDSAALQGFLNQLPLGELKKTLASDGVGWAPAIAEALLTRCPATDTYFKAYPRFMKRFLDFATQAGMLAVERETLMPEWEDFLARATLLMPQNKAQLVALAAAGATMVLDKYPINNSDLDATNTKLQNVRSAMRRLAKFASAAGLTPHGFAEEVLSGPRQGDLGDFAGQTVYCSYCRCLWNATVLNHPELDLPLWGDRRRQIAIAMAQWPHPLRDGVNAAVFERPSMKPLKPLTIKNYRDKLCGIVGILEQAGFELAPLVSDLVPRDAVRLIFQGWPRELLTGNPAEDAALAIYRRLLREPGYRDNLLAKMREQEGRMGQNMLEENPFIAEVLAERYAQAKYASAEGMLDRVYAINSEYLAQRDGNLKWLKSRFDQVNAFMADHETAYDEKKQVVFKHPRLFEQLLARAGQLYNGLDDQFTSKGPHWATFVRDLTYFTLVTLYPLRVTNHQLMKLGDNYDPDRHTLSFKKQEVKNKKPIEFELPDEGTLLWVRDLVDLYLAEARPILLRGAVSEYFFVGNHQAPNAKGFLQRQGFNELLVDFTQKHLEGVVPAELGNLNPHLFRHIAATYRIVVCGDPNGAAMLLNDKIDTIYKHYADILGASRQSCKAFYNGY